MEILFTRIDDRLVHGQVTTTWLRQYKCNSIFIIDDEVAVNPLLKKILKATVPQDVKMVILDTKKAIEMLKDNGEEKIFIITKRPRPILKLVENEIKIDSVNIGGMQPKPGSKKISKAVSVTKEDIDDFKKLAEKGIELEIRMVPTDPKIDLIKLI